MVLLVLCKEDKALASASTWFNMGLQKRDISYKWKQWLWCCENSCLMQGHHTYIASWELCLGSMRLSRLDTTTWSTYVICRGNPKRDWRNESQKARCGRCGEKEWFKYSPRTQSLKLHHLWGFWNCLKIAHGEAFIVSPFVLLWGLMSSPTQLGTAVYRSHPEGVVHDLDRWENWHLAS